MLPTPSKLQGFLIKGLFCAVAAAGIWGNYQYISTKNLKIDNQKQAIVQLEEDKKLLKAELVKKVQSDKTTGEVKVEVRKEEVKVEKAKTTANQYVEKKLAEIEAKYAVMEKNATNAEHKRTEISLERARGLWMTFCLQEPEEKACK